tara:strand:- start:246 stop:1244 length:999 start_codon:yes stop_codon:yes gene_type:complete
MRSDGLVLRPVASASAPQEEGSLVFDSIAKSLRLYANFAWTNISKGTATGGVANISGSYKIHKFTSSGTFTVVGGPLEVEIFVVGGGGGGGDHNGGGGGGGTVIHTEGRVVSGSTAITVGAGGAASANGTYSSFGGASSLTKASPGGLGGDYQIAAGDEGSGGGDDGRGNGDRGDGTIPTVASDSTAYGGYDGGNGVNNFGLGGGGAGAAANGSHGVQGVAGGDGGAGVQIDMGFESTYYWGGGGGGAGWNDPHDGGDGGTGGGGGGGSNYAGGGGAGDTNGINSAGNGAAGNNAGTGGAAGTNTGGGGGGASQNISGGSGGSGIVVVRYLV